MKINISNALKVCSILSFSISIQAQKIALTTENPTVETHYRSAWKLIMDQGYYGPAEEEFRQAYQADTNCILPALNYARIIKDTLLQATILQQSLRALNLTKGESLLRNVYADLVRMTIARSRKKQMSASEREHLLIEIEHHLRQVVRLYPEEPYVLAEYIEVIHANQGPEPALDSLNHYIAEGRPICIFLEAYQISLQIEAGRIDSIRPIQLKGIQRTQSVCPKPHVLWAEYYWAKDKKRKALRQVNKALKLDKKNLDAIRLKQKIVQT